ncbi:hypothetical protein [Clostridium sporogenes]|uniref:hypothetical protein n=1 Tax=Clostridium sporogenes TaxID=1509 RepID=UPI0007176403|nr:hypothetical protein [Clostridium sporogenes]KRU40047.1 hypothetical protein VT94_25240 [Clostridium sporogenes]MBY7065138.1 hypothetical protein [Clostridium sporogenes]MBY7071816.1 hypothetical protein [Clostridium sporogenes]MCW6065874.1 hypothetical protein [Clostridium sporogenes]OQP88555.1 hypothetical protein VT93_0201990 [Clostridium sporogenes]
MQEVLKELGEENELKNMEVLEQRINKAFTIANNAIFFSDRSNYLKILYEVCRILNPSSSSKIGSKYIHILEEKVFSEVDSTGI